MTITVICKGCNAEMDVAENVPATLICNHCGSGDITTPPSIKKIHEDQWPANMHMLVLKKGSTTIGDEGNEFPLQKEMASTSPKTPTAKKTKRSLKPRKTKKTKK